MSNGKVLSHERTKTDHKVEITAGPHRRSHTVEHIVVGDILKFAKALEEAGADEWEQVRARLVARDGYLLHHLLVQWSEDLINGQPAPKAEPRADKDPSP